MLVSEINLHCSPIQKKNQYLHLVEIIDLYGQNNNFMIISKVLVSYHKMSNCIASIFPYFPIFEAELSFFFQKREQKRRTFDQWTSWTEHRAGAEKYTFLSFTNNEWCSAICKNAKTGLIWIFVLLFFCLSCASIHFKYPWTD